MARRRARRRNPGGLGFGTWLALGLGALWAYRRKQDADKAGVPVAKALLAPFTPIAQLAATGKPIATVPPPPIN